MNKWNLRRRELLSSLGAGAALLPLLQARGVRAQGITPPKRLIVVAFPNGYCEDNYVPRGSGDDLTKLTLSESLSALNPWRDQLTFLGPMTCPNVADAEDYHRSYAMMLSGSAPVAKPLGSGSVWAPTGPTIDQIVGVETARRDNLSRRVLSLGLPLGSLNFVDSTIEGSHPYWAGRGQPVSPQLDPYKLVNELFGGKAPEDLVMKKLRAERRSMLDFLGRDLQRFAAQLGTEDRFSIEGHLQGIRDIEKQLAPAADIGSIPLPQPDMGLDPTSQADYPALLKVQFDIMVTALRAGITRVATVQLGPAWGDGFDFPWLPSTEGRMWHQIGHGPYQEKHKITIDKWFTGQFAALLERLAVVPEPGPKSQTMLDNTTILWATTMLSGHHVPHQPWIIAGGGGGYFKKGQYLRSAINKPNNHALVDIANAMDVPVNFVGNPDIQGPLPGLKA